MATFRQKAPDGNTYSIEGPEGATDEQVRTEILRQNPAAGTAPERVEQRGVGERIGTGFMDPFYGMAQVGARMMDPGEEMAGLVSPLHEQEREKRIAEVDAIVRKREQEIQGRAGKGIDWWRLVGQAANPALYAPALTGGLVGAAASGMMAGFTQPEPEAKDFYSRKVTDSLLGAAFGVGAGAVTQVAGKAVSPIIGRAAKELMDRGVELTPGRLAGQLMSRAEDAARSIPWIGWFIRNAADRSNRSFNVAAVNTTLHPIGVVMPEQIPAGRPAIEFAENALGDAYDNLLNRPDVGLVRDEGVLRDLAGIMQKAQGLGSTLADNYGAKLHQAVAMRFLGGRMSGVDLKAAESELGQYQKRYLNSQVASERDLGDLFGEAKDAIREALQRQNPQVAAELGPINQAYAMFKRIQGASARRAGSGKEEGVFTPMDLAAAARKADPSKDKAAFARGEAIMQELAEWGLFVLPQRVPDSGTAERSLWALLGIGGATVGLPQAALLAAKGSLAAVPYLPPVVRGINRLARTAPRRRGVRAGIETAAPFVGGAAGVPAGAAVQRYDGSGNPVQ